MTDYLVINLLLYGSLKNSDASCLEYMSYRKGLTQQQNN